MTHFGSVRAAKQTDSLYRGNLINMNNTSKTNFPLRPRQRMSISMEICMHSCRDLNQFCFKFDPLGRAPCSQKNKKCFRAPPRSFQRGIWAKKSIKKLQTTSQQIWAPPRRATGKSLQMAWMEPVPKGPREKDRKC